MKSPLRFLLFAALSAPPLLAEDKTVSVSIESTSNQAVTFTTPKGSDTDDKTLTINGVGAGITAANTTMTSGITTNSAHDSTQWFKDDAGSVGLTHVYRITAAKSTTPIAVIVNGRLRDNAPAPVPGSSGGGGTVLRNTPFNVTAPYAALMSSSTLKRAQDDPYNERKTRLTVGVGEEIQFNVTQTHLAFPSVSCSGGYVYPNEGDNTATTSLPAGTNQFYFRAPGSKQQCTITLTFAATGVVSLNGFNSPQGASATFTVSVVAPTGESVERVGNNASNLTPGRYGAMMNLIYYAIPTNVNFSAVEVRELGGETYGQPQNPTGFWVLLNAQKPGILVHYPTPEWIRYDDSSSWTDLAGWKGTENPPPFSNSTFHWNIPFEWRCFGSTPVRLYSRTQSYEMMDTRGTMKVKKTDSRGISVESSPRTP